MACHPPGLSLSIARLSGEAAVDLRVAPMLLPELLSSIRPIVRLVVCVAPPTLPASKGHPRVGLSSLLTARSTIATQSAAHRERRLGAWDAVELSGRHQEVLMRLWPGDHLCSEGSKGSEGRVCLEGSEVTRGFRGQGLGGNGVFRHVGKR